MSYGTATSIPAIYAGDFVELKYPSAKEVGKVFRVNKVMQVNLSCVDEHGRSWKVPMTAVKTTDKKFELPEVVVTIGSVVTIKGMTGHFVVIKLGEGVVNVTKLGGDAGRYYRSVPLSRLTDVGADVLAKI